MSGLLFDPDAWDGDTEMLLPGLDELSASPDLCNQAFGSKHEAFPNGLSLGYRTAVEGASST